MLIEDVARLPFSAVRRDKAAVMALLRYAAKNITNGAAPRFCDTALRGYYLRLTRTGANTTRNSNKTNKAMKASTKTAIENRTCEPRFKGKVYHRTGGFFYPHLLTDASARRALDAGYLKKSHFSIQPPKKTQVTEIEALKNEAANAYDKLANAELTAAEQAAALAETIKKIEAAEDAASAASADAASADAASTDAASADPTKTDAASTDPTKADAETDKNAEG